MNAGGECSFEFLLIVIGIPVDSLKTVVGQKEIEFLSLGNLHDFLWLI